MCGLVGWISNSKMVDSFDKRKAFEQALILDTVRGGDSTGMFTVDSYFTDKEKPYARWFTQLGGGHEFVIGQDFQDAFSQGKAGQYKFVVGHNRSATVGGVTLEAAHPFNEGPITLVHNGTVKREYTSEKELANDSHGICWKLSKEDPEKVIKELDGAFALIWHDARDDSLNFVRNAQRPLHFAKVQGLETIYFASEAELLYWLDKRLTLHLQDIVSMKPAHWLKFSGSNLMAPTVKQVELYSPKAVKPDSWAPAQWHSHGPTSTTNMMPMGNMRGRKDNLNQKWLAGLNTGTKKKKIKFPENLELDLYEYNLSPEDIVNFVPLFGEKFGSNVSPSMSVMGWIVPEDPAEPMIPAVIHGVSLPGWNASKNRVWSVYPLGIYKLNYNLPMVVTRLASTLDIQNKIREIPPDKRPPPITRTTVYTPVVIPEGGAPKQEPLFQIAVQRDDDAPEDSPAVWDAIFPGPNGLFLTRGDWFVATSSGCSSCGRDLLISQDAFDLAWHDNAPICNDCRKEDLP